MFLRLPPEIRNIIYSIILTSAQPVQLMPCSPSNSLTIVGACRQTYDEAIPVFYGRNRFRLDNPEALHRFLRSISLRRRRQIRHVILDFWHKRSPHATAAFNKLGQCIRLRYLKVYIERAGELVRGFTGIRAFRALRGLKEVEFRLDGYYDMEVGGKFVEEVKKELLEPRRPCKRCERVGSPV